MIAAIIQSPSYYPTTAGKAALEARWHYVLNGLVGMGDLTAQQAAAEKFPDRPARPGPAHRLVPVRPVRAGLVKNELEATYHYSSAQIDNDGLRITTTISKHMMDRLYAAVNDNEKLDGRRTAARCRRTPWSGRSSRTRRPGRSSPSTAASAPTRRPRSVTKLCENDTVLTREQVGSSFKPYVLATAVQQGMNVQTTQLDGYSPLWIPPDSEPTTPAARSEDQAVASSAKDSERRQRGLWPDERGPGRGAVVQHRVHRPHPPGGHARTWSTWPSSSGSTP